jgi:hypothetical protein
VRDVLGGGWRDAEILSQRGVHMRRIVLPDAGRDLSSFWLEGFADGLLVSASWDGHILVVADGLVGRVVLARAVDSIYHGAGLEPGSSGFSITGSATRALLTLIELCEDLICVEYESATENKRLV